MVTVQVADENLVHPAKPDPEFPELDLCAFPAID
jgi:hypothetical protein